MFKLKHLDEYIAARRKAADFYDQAFAGHAKIKYSIQGCLW
jgi:dTDP-4-amino-4,6-dideoxygalactose transaminase